MDDAILRQNSSIFPKNEELGYRKYASHAEINIDESVKYIEIYARMNQNMKPASFSVEI